MSHTVTESIYAGKTVLVPLADVQHIETHNLLGLAANAALKVLARAHQGVAA